MTQALEDTIRRMACDPTLTTVQRMHLTDAWNRLGFDRAEVDRLRRTLQAIANTDHHEKDGVDCTAETMRKFASKALKAIV